MGGKNARIELTFSLPLWFGSLWPYSLLGVSLDAMVATLLREGFGPLLSSFQVEAVSTLGIVVILAFGAIGVSSLWLE